MATGTVKKWFGGRGFGFVVPSDGAPDLFVHIRNVVGRPEGLEPGQMVRFVEGTDERSGKVCAMDVEVI